MLLLSFSRCLSLVLTLYICSSAIAEVIKVDLSQQSEMQSVGMFHLTIQSIPSENERWCLGGSLSFTRPSNVVAVNKTFKLIKNLMGSDVGQDSQLMYKMLFYINGTPQALKHERT